jgi:sulfide dehydrogenase cytochrome subunit
MRHELVAIALLAVASGLIPGAASAQSGQAMGQTCFVCHGPGGRSDGTVAPIAGLPKEHVARQMADFKADRRPGTIMNRIAKGYTDEQTAQIVEYLATLK